MALQTGDIRKIEPMFRHRRPLPRQATSIIQPPGKIRPYIIIVSTEMQKEKYIEASQQDMPLRE